MVRDCKSILEEGQHVGWSTVSNAELRSSNTRGLACGLGLWHLHVIMYYYMACQKIPQHENVDFSQMREYFNTKLSSFTQHTVLHN